MEPVIRASATQLLKQICKRAPTRGDVLLKSVETTDWQSIVYAGEKHEIALAATPDVAFPITDGLEDADISLDGYILADITSATRSDGDKTIIEIEALTLKESPDHD